MLFPKAHRAQEPKSPRPKVARSVHVLFAQVWEVRWTNTTDERLNFWSISSDGRVANWRLMKNRIESEEHFELKLQGAGEVLPRRRGAEHGGRDVETVLRVSGFSRPDCQSIRQMYSREGTVGWEGVREHSGGGRVL